MGDEGTHSHSNRHRMHEVSDTALLEWVLDNCILRYWDGTSARVLDDRQKITQAMNTNNEKYN